MNRVDAALEFIGEVPQLESKALAGGRRAPNPLSGSRWGPGWRPHHSGWKSVGVRGRRRKQTHILSVLSHQQARGTTNPLGSSARTAPAQSLTLQTTPPLGACGASSRAQPGPAPHSLCSAGADQTPIPTRQCLFPARVGALCFPSPCSHAHDGWDPGLAEVRHQAWGMGPSRQRGWRKGVSPHRRDP